MKTRILIIVALVGALIGSVVATQGADAAVKHHKRTATGTYQTPAVGAAGQGGGGCAQKNGTGCVEFATSKTDHTISITITDQSGQPVYASVSQDEQSSGQVHQTVAVGDICGKTTKALSITGGYPVDIFLWEGPGADPPCAGVATQGTVKAVFSS